ncbi:internal scaffolding protein [Apis mellifera associated microvirus 11]|nr:internal scaffolding protein [Apis mellifera associated microvirus 11]AZL82777.1 internal scaffolding protein [Apis mellifera associated microvirus 11]
MAKDLSIPDRIRAHLSTGPYIGREDWTPALTDELNRQTAFKSDQESLTRQELGDETDVNRIVQRYGGNVFQADPSRYGFTDDRVDYQKLLELREGAAEAFYALPEDIRASIGSVEAYLALRMQDVDLDGILGRLEAARKALDEPLNPPAEPGAGSPPPAAPEAARSA